jgi:hypothetical protein
MRPHWRLLLLACKRVAKLDQPWLLSRLKVKVSVRVTGLVLLALQRGAAQTAAPHVNVRGRGSVATIPTALEQHGYPLPVCGHARTYHPRCCEMIVTCHISSIHLFGRHYLRSSPPPARPPAAQLPRLLPLADCAWRGSPLLLFSWERLFSFIR